MMTDTGIDMTEMLAIRKRREVNGFKGFRNTDSLALINNSMLFRVNNKIDTLNEQIKNLVVKYKDELKKITKRCEKHKQSIIDELEVDLNKQKSMYEEVSKKNTDELESLNARKSEDIKVHTGEINELVQSKEQLLTYVTTENDDLETEILRLNENLIEELNKVEANHKSAIEQLVEKYENSLKGMKNEITTTVKKLKENATYFETVLNEQEDEYETEILGLEHTKLKNEAQERALNMEKEVKKNKDEHYNTYHKHKEKDEKRLHDLQEMKKLIEEFDK